MSVILKNRNLGLLQRFTLTQNIVDVENVSASRLRILRILVVIHNHAALRTVCHGGINRWFKVYHKLNLRKTNPITNPSIGRLALLKTNKAGRDRPDSRHICMNSCRDTRSRTEHNRLVKLMFEVSIDNGSDNLRNAFSCNASTGASLSSCRTARHFQNGQNDRGHVLVELIELVDG